MLWMIWGLPVLFFVLGVGMIVGAVHMIRVLHGHGAVEVEARCIYVETKDEMVKGVGNQHYRFLNVKIPTYEYYYEGKRYVSEPMLHSNRPGYQPQEGPCRIFINPRQPQKVYSSERKAAGMILSGIGILFCLVGMVAAVVFAVIF